MNPNIPQPSRLPYWAIWLGLLAVLAVLVSGAFLLNKQFRTRIGIEGGDVTVAGASAGASPSGSPLLPSAAVSPSNSALALQPVPSASPDSSPLAQEVSAAYQRYWQIYSDALLSLDASKVTQVATGDELRRIQEEVDGVRRQNEAVRINVDHHYFVFNVSATQANVYDEIQNHSFTVDPTTKQPAVAPSDHTDLEKDTYFFEKDKGVWKVSKSTRDRGGGS